MAGIVLLSQIQDVLKHIITADKAALIRQRFGVARVLPATRMVQQ